MNRLAARRHSLPVVCAVAVLADPVLVVALLDLAVVPQLIVVRLLQVRDEVPASQTSLPSASVLTRRQHRQLSRPKREGHARHNLAGRNADDSPSQKAKAAAKTGTTARARRTSTSLANLPAMLPGVSARTGSPTPARRADPSRRPAAPSPARQSSGRCAPGSNSWGS